MQIIKYAPKETTKHLANKELNRILDETNLDNFDTIFNWKRLYYELYQETFVQIEYTIPKIFNNMYLNGTINRVGKLNNDKIFYMNKHDIKLETGGVLFADKHDISNPSIRKWVPVNLGEKIMQISLSTDINYSILLTKKGKMWVLGNGQNGQFGDGRNKVMNQYEILEWDERIIHVSCGECHSMMITESGKLYVTGYNTDYQLGLGDNNNRNCWTLANISEKIIDAKCSLYHSFALTDKGKLYVTGANYWGQLGLADEIIRKWTEINIPEKIIYIECNRESSISLTEIGNIYGVWTFRLHIETQKHDMDKIMFSEKSGIYSNRRPIQILCRIVRRQQCVCRK